MADKKISALTAATTPLAGTEVLPIVQSGATVKVAVSDLTAGRAISATAVTASTGNFIVGTSGQGIDFSATPGTGTSELLADYEEGTWTPTRSNFIEVLGAGTITTTGTYTKIGNVVNIQILLACAGGATIAAANGGNSFFGNLPFTVAKFNSATWTNASTLTTSGGMLVHANSNFYVTTSWAAASESWCFTATYTV
jgi:hypothetical protein